MQPSNQQKMCNHAMRIGPDDGMLWAVGSRMMLGRDSELS